MDFTKLVTSFITDPATALLIILILSAIAAFATGKVIPRPIYDREVKRADKADDTNAQMIAAQRDVAEALKDLTTEVLRK